MTDDIVTRLRNYDFLRDGDYPEVWMNEAADEIERLRKLGDQLAYWGRQDDGACELKTAVKAWEDARGNR